MAALLIIGYWYLHNIRPIKKGVPIPGIYRAYADGKQAGEKVIPDLPLVLCYHQVREWTSSDSQNDRIYIVPLHQFREQMKLLHEAGYHTVLPDQWGDHMLQGTPLPPKPFLLTFDDGTQCQYDNALPELDRYGYKAVFFIMTVTLDKPRFMTRDEIRRLSGQGHLIGCHTWDHHDVNDYSNTDWEQQIVKPVAELEQITDKPVHYFAYPFGDWNITTIARLKKQGFLAAYQLGGPINRAEPCFTIRRILVNGNWNAGQLMTAIFFFDRFKSQ